MAGMTPLCLSAWRLAGNITFAEEENSAVMTMLQALLMIQMKERTTTIVDQQAVKMDDE